MFICHMEFVFPFHYEARYSKCTIKSPVCITAFKVSVFNSRSTDFVTLVYVIFNLFHRQSFFDLEFNSLVK